LEKTYSLGEPIQWKSLGSFIQRCNQVLGRNAVVSAGSDGLISAIDLTTQEIATIKDIIAKRDILDSREVSKFRNLTPEQVENKLTEINNEIDAITNLAQVKALLKKLAGFEAVLFRGWKWYLDREEGKLAA
jgi:hypothetical protein